MIRQFIRTCIDEFKSAFTDGFRLAAMSRRERAMEVHFRNALIACHEAGWRSGPRQSVAYIAHKTWADAEKAIATS